MNQGSEKEALVSLNLTATPTYQDNSICGERMHISERFKAPNSGLAMIQDAGQNRRYCYS
jgi:hypothetical protein